MFRFKDWLSYIQGFSQQLIFQTSWSTFQARAVSHSKAELPLLLQPLHPHLPKVPMYPCQPLQAPLPVVGAASNIPRGLLRTKCSLVSCGLGSALNYPFHPTASSFQPTTPDYTLESLRPEAVKDWPEISELVARVQQRNVWRSIFVC